MWFLRLREKYRLKEFENKMMSSFGPKNEEVIGETETSWGCFNFTLKLHYYSYYSYEDHGSSKKCRL
jgi:hypothetical protein